MIEAARIATIGFAEIATIDAVEARLSLRERWTIRPAFLF
jgi:hypothetical protein